MAKLNEDDRMFWSAIADAFATYADALHGLKWLNDPADTLRHALQHDTDCYPALDVYGLLSESVQRELVPDLLALAARRAALRRDIDERLALLPPSVLVDCLKTTADTLLRGHVNCRIMDELLRVYMCVDTTGFAQLLPDVCAHPDAAMRALGESYWHRIWG
jgi:hypothetical protein